MAAQRQPEHPASVLVRGDVLLGGVLEFFARRLFSPQRRVLLAQDVPKVAGAEVAAWEARAQALQRTLASHPACPKAAVACRLEMPGDLELLGRCCPPRARRQRRCRPRAVASADRPTNAHAADHRRLPAHNDLRVRLIKLAWREGVTLATRPPPHHRTRAAEALTHPEVILKVAGGR